ncbi:MAG: hypothetical protein L0196_09100 [candidate division Zixibacteria bacterium]|nr:hypothetical protein [candidate division Zixibacteria bacterium]
MKMKSQPVALGFRVKSGRAIAVLVSGSKSLPQVLDHRVVQLSDPARPETIQPYHARMGKLEENRATIKRRTGIVERAAQKSVTDLLKEYRSKGYKIQTAGLVVGSLIDPAIIGNPHVRAHALEGRLFRTVLEKALRRQKLPSFVILERDIYPRGEAALGKTEGELKNLLADIGRPLEGPWRADEKVAALAAWTTFGRTPVKRSQMKKTSR